MLFRCSLRSTATTSAPQIPLLHDELGYDAFLNGLHAITAVAKDAANNASTSTAVNVTVNNLSSGLWEFNQDGNAQGWTNSNQLTAVTVLAGTC